MRGLDVEVIIAELIKDDFLNEERFAKSYCRGKFYMKGWGKNKIARELRRRDISDYCMKKGFKEIDLKDYRNMLTKILIKKIKTTPERDPWKLRQKVVSHALTKGYESELIYHLLDELK